MAESSPDIEGGKPLRRLLAAPLNNPPPPPLPAPASPRRHQNRVLRACEGCRTRKAKCSGQRPKCDACLHSGQVCVYNEGRQEQLRRATERYQTLTQLLSSLRDRVPVSLQQEIDASLEQTGRLIEDDSTSPVSPASMGNLASSAVPSQTSQGINVVRSQIQQNLTRLPVDSTTAMEIQWFLQTQPYEAAHDALKHIRSQAPLDEFQHQTFSMASGNALHPILLSSKDSHRGSLQSYDFSATRSESQSITISSVRIAVAKYFQSPSLLFYVISEDQAEQILHQVFDGYEEATVFNQVVQDSRTSQQRARLAEIAGMAAVGLLYLCLGNPHFRDSRTDAYFYNITRRFLDDAIETDPLRSMKVCAFIALYNMIVKARVAVAYIELGLGIARSYGLDGTAPCVTIRPDIEDHRKTWGSLVCFASWLSVTLNYTSKQNIPDLSILERTQHSDEQRMIQVQLVKITVLKAKIKRTFDNNGLRTADGTAIKTLSDELNAFTQQLPASCNLKSLLTSQTNPPLRAMKYYLHLFYLSAIQLVHRRIMANPQLLHSFIDRHVEIAVKEGLMAAKMASRILRLMRQEGSIVQLCWLCTYTSYTSALIILHAAVHRILQQGSSRLWKTDLSLVNISLDVLNFCAEMDDVAQGLRDVVVENIRRIGDIADISPDDDFANIEEDSIEYIFTPTPGNSELEINARDLRRLVIQPFSAPLESISGKGSRGSLLRNTLISWMEASVGAPQEWQWDLESSLEILSLDNQEPVAESSGSGRRQSPLLELAVNLEHGRFNPRGDSGWSDWPTSTGI